MIEELVATAPRVPRGRRRLLSRRELPRLREALRPARRRGGNAQSLRGGRGGEPEGGPARLRALEGAQGGRGHLVGIALGPRPSGLAHRVLRDGRGAPRAGLRDPRRWARSGLPAPRERGRAVALARPRVRAALDAQRDAAALRREDVEVDRQHRLAARGGGGAWGARRCSSTSSAATGASRSSTRTRSCSRRQPRPRASATCSAALRAGRRLGGVRGRARRRLQHAGGARRPCTAGATTSCCGADSRSSGSSRSAEDASAPAELEELARAARRGTRTQGLRRRATGCATRSKRRAGRFATWTPRPGFQLVPKR